jgi:hypothetical protein
LCWIDDSSEKEIARDRRVGKVSMLGLGPHTEAQRTEFVELFKRFLSDGYAAKLETY